MANGPCAAGLSVRNIQAHLKDVYRLQVSPDLISRVTKAVPDKVRERQHRAPDRMYPILMVDALRVKIRDADSRIVKIEPLLANGPRTLARGCQHRPWRHPGKGSRGSGVRGHEKSPLACFPDERTADNKDAGCR